MRRAGAPGGSGPERRGTAAPPAAGTETVDQMCVAKYVQALGGQQALQNAKTRVMTGTVTTRDLVTSNVDGPGEGDRRIPHRHRDAADPDHPRDQRHGGVGDRRRRRGGGGGGAPDAPRDLAGFQMQQGLRLADFSLPLHLKERYQTSRSTRPTTPSTASRSWSSPARPYPNVTEQLSFDRETGLLLRRTIVTGSGGVGFGIMDLGEQIDYSDYRDVERRQGAVHGPARDVERGDDREVHRREDQRARSPTTSSRSPRRSRRSHERSASQAGRITYRAAT